MTMATPFHFGSCSAMAMAQTRGQAAESFRPDRLAVAVESNQAPTSFYGDQLLLLRRSLRAPGCMQITGRRSSEGPLRRKGGVGIRCALQDLIGGDLLKFDLEQWLDDVEKHKALAIYSPHEGGYEGRYLTRLRYQGYYFLDLSARGLGDPETTLTKIHPVCPAHLGRQPIARWYYPPEIDYRLSLLPPDSKGLILWVIEAKVLSKAELQFLALLPSIRPKVKVIAECGNWRKFVWKPLKEIAGLPLDDEA